MKRSSRVRHGLAASFVVVVAAPACKKTTVNDPEPTGSVGGYLGRNYVTGECTLSPVVHCPKGASCNPPAPDPVDCPPEMRDAGDAPAITRRPLGKSDWLRVKPRLSGWNGHCTYVPERFCAPANKPYSCTPWADPISVPCTKADDAGTAFKTDAFVWKDILGTCRTIPSLTCDQGMCTSIPDGEVTACP